MSADNHEATVDVASTLPQKIFSLVQYLLPHHLLSRVMYWVTRSEWRPFKDLIIRNIIKIYKVDMDLAADQEPTNYRSFNDFFTRALKPEARPLAKGKQSLLSPVDGTVSQAGQIVDGRIFQAKGRDFSLHELLGGDRKWTSAFTDGSYATIYLSPRDYHRIHMPSNGILKKMIHVPGRLFSVSPSTTRNIPRLFSRNERVVNLFETEAGPMAVIMVGAIFVSSMDTVWAGTITPKSRRVTGWEYGKKSTAAIKLQQGAEMGRFNMGSTVILLFGKDAVELATELKPEAKMQMGQQIGTVTSTPAE
ncbi:MAG: phosphatidylserine decarboxylase [Gammaproteobacteria bacterium]|nr:phosphatidylserine decarboxylase [Gammaproteobacteria bacterium]